MSEWDPEAYGLVNSLQQEVARRALGDLTVRGDEGVLDLGCGDGRVTAMIADRLTTGSLVGVDPSEAMVQAARRRLAADGRAEFAVSSGARLTYEAEFDLVVSFNALHWEPRWQTALQRIHAALGLGGRALLVFVCAGERVSLEDVLMQTARSPRWQSWFEDFDAPFVHVDPDEYATAAVAAGFEVEHLVVTDIDWDFGYRAVFEEWCSAGTVAWTSRLPDRDRADFVAEVITTYSAISGSDTMFKFLQCRVSLTAR